MIIQIIGNVNYPITLDPSVWIFDDRKILFDEAFSHKKQSSQTKIDELKITANRWDKEVYQQHTRPPVNKSISKIEREQALKSSYVMPITDFLSHAEIKSDTTDVTLETIKGNINIPLKTLHDCYLLFAISGSPVKNEGPVHLYFKDGSNQKSPITGLQKILINASD